MPQLPDRPDLDQLRHQARELHRAAAQGDVPALDRLRAGLAAGHAVHCAAGPGPRLRLPQLEPAPGRGAAPPGPATRRTPPAPEWGRRWTESADELITGQYADRPQLRPILDTVLADAAHARAGDRAGPQDRRLAGLAAPHVRRGAGHHQEPGGPRPAAGRRRAGRARAASQEHRQRHHQPADRAGRARATSTTRSSAGSGGPTTRASRRPRRGARPGGRSRSSGR